MRAAASHESSRFVGVDFSGAASSWLPTAANATVWIAFLDGRRQHYALGELCPVQDLPGAGDAFSKLVNWLREGKFTAAAIDAHSLYQQATSRTAVMRNYYAESMRCR